MLNIFHTHLFILLTTFTSLSLRICTYNIHGFSDTKCDYLQNVIDNHDIVMLQEHWLYDSQSHLFQDKFPCMSSYCVSGMNDQYLSSGRGFGGCAILWKSSLSCTVELVNIDNNRVCAVMVKFHDVCLLLCCIYMPCDTTYDRHNIETYNAVFSDILSSNACNNVNHVVIGGDLNTDLSRPQSAHTECIRLMCSREDMKCVFDHTNCSIDYTYESMSNASRSCIDQFIVSESLFHSVEHCCVTHDGDNLSDHSVVSLQLAIEVTHNTINVCNFNKLLWRKASHSQLNTYQSNLDTALSDVLLRDNVVQCNDMFCHAHHADIQMYHDNIVKACLQASTCIPISKPGGHRKCIPGWTEFVDEYKDKAIFWHKIWKENGSPHSGIVFNIRRKTRWEYHYMLKLVRRNKDGISAQKMSDGLSGTGFWSEVKRIIGNHKMSPNTIDDVQGVDEIANLFKEKYNTLYNSVSFDPLQMSDLVEETNCNIRDLPNDYTTHDLFSVKDIDQCILLLKPGKSGGPSCYSSDHIMHGTQLLRSHITKLFNVMISHGFAPTDFRVSTLVPIPKNKRKSINLSDNFRAIALSSILGKVLDNIILLKYNDVFNTSDMQYGFKKRHSTNQCTFVVSETVQYYLNNDTNVYVTLLDASRAFDRVNYVKLFRLLSKRKLCPLMLRFLIVFYTNQSIRVQWGSSMSIFCSVSNGVKQGGVLSPILFTVYVDELLCRLSNARFGCYVGNLFCGAVGYADDITLLAPTVTSLNYMLDICQNFAEAYDVLFNASKSRLLYFSKAKSLPDISPITFNGSVIEVVKHEKHLGNIIGQNCSKDQLQDCIYSFQGKVNMVKTHFHHTNPDGLYQIFKTYRMPLYGSQLWNYNNSNVNTFYVSWRKAIRKLFNLPYRTHCNLLPYIIDDLPPNIQLYHRVISFVNGLSKSNNELTSMCYKLAVSGSGSAVSNSISILSSLCSTPRSNVCNINKCSLPVAHDDDASICASVIRDLLYIKHVNQYYPNMHILNNEDINFMLDCLCTE